MSEEVATRLPFWKECLRLLYWAFFKPRTLENYIDRLDLGNPKTLQFIINAITENLLFKRLLYASLVNIFLLPLPIALILVKLADIISDPAISWGAVVIGVFYGILIGILGGIVSGFFGGIGGDKEGVVIDIGITIIACEVLGLLGGVSGGIATGMSGGSIPESLMAGGTAGAAIGIVASIIFSPYGIFYSVFFGVMSAVGFGLGYYVEAGLSGVMVLSLSVIIAYLRLFLYLPELLWVWLALTYKHFKASRSTTMLRLLPTYYDEVIWFPLFGLHDILRQAARHDLPAALSEVARLSDSLGQKGQANLAKADITADVMASYTSVEQLASCPEQIDWLPDDLKQVRPDLPEMLPGLLAISRELSLALESGSPLSQRLALREAMDQLDGLQKKLNFLGREGKERWSPVLGQWHKVMQSSLEAAAHFSQSAGGVENPYQAGTPLPLSRRRLFKGRQELVSELANALRERGRPTLILHGPRRMGKTSFLLQLPALLPGRTVPVFISLQDPAVTSSDSAFLYAIAHAITRDAQPQRLILPAPERERFDTRPYEALDEWLGRAWKALQDFNLLLTFDEFEQAGEAFDSGQLSRKVWNQLRTLIEHQQRMALLFAGVQTLDELGPNYSSYFINARSLSMGYLEPTEAEELIRNPDPQVRFDLTYDDDVVERILEETLGHPYLVQLVCSCLVECANRRQSLHADLALVEEAEELAFERGANYFNNIWLEMAGEEGQALLRRVAATEGALPLEAQDTAQRKALSRMLRLKVLHKSEDGYTVEVPLVARWVNEYAMD